MLDLHAFFTSNTKADCLLLPKLESAYQCVQLDNLLTSVGLTTKIIALIETASGLETLPTLINAPDRLAGLMLGAADLSAYLNCKITSSSIDSARIQIICACAESDCCAIDSPYFNLNDTEGLKVNTYRIRDMGFSGKAAIHPKHIDIRPWIKVRLYLHLRWVIKKMYDFIDCNPSVYSHLVDYVNDPKNIAINEKVISVNSTIEIDLLGECNSEHMLGHQYSASKRSA